jgi:iron complex outermembrane receptor protein
MKLFCSGAKTMAVRQCGSAALVAAVAGAFASPAAAQQAAGAATGAAPGQLEQIVVTARTRAESLQEVPLSVTAFTSEEMARSAIADLKDVARFTAGFNYEDYSGGFGTPVLRGATQNRLTALEQNVSVFFDRVYLPRSWLYGIGVANIERIEVVKGPQSARYGRNAFMGAINFIPKGPSDSLDASVMAGLGGDDRREAAGSIGGSIVPGLLTAHAHVAWEEFDGAWKNEHPLADAGVSPGTDGNLGGFDNLSFSGALRFTPLEGLALDLRYYDFDLENEVRPVVPNGTGLRNLNCGARLPNGAFRLLCGEVPFKSGPFLLDPRTYAANTDSDILRGEISYEITDALSVDYLYGRVRGAVKSVTVSDVNQATCGDNAPGLCTFQNVPNGTVDYASHELRGQYRQGSLLAGLGAYYLDGTDLEQFTFYFARPVTTTPVTPIEDPIRQPGALLLTNSETDTRNVSFFGEFQYAFLGDALRLGAEARYTEETKSVTNLSNGARFEETFYTFTPRVTAEYDLATDRLVYASVAKGTKAGGFNPTAFLVENRTYDPDVNWTYEIGSKNMLFDRRVVLNVAAFYTRWSDLQVNSPNVGSPVAATAAQIVLNFGDATLYGIEIEAAAQVTERLKFNAALSLNDATFDDGTVDGVAIRQPTPCDDVVCRRDGQVGGNDLPRQAKEQLSLGAEWQDDLGFFDAGYYLRADVGYQSKQYLDSLNTGWVSPRTLVNATVGFTRGAYEVQLWARNLLDEEYVASSFATVTPTASAFNATLGEPRTYGLRLRARF